MYPHRINGTNYDGGYDCRHTRRGMCLTGPGQHGTRNESLRRNFHFVAQQNDATNGPTSDALQIIIILLIQDLTLVR